MSTSIAPDILQDYMQSSKLEWIETNGLGGYAGSSVSGANTRRYHGLLIAALNPPVDRRVVLSKLEESVIAGGSHYLLSANQFPGAIHPQGQQHLKRFQRAAFPVFEFKVGDTVIRKTIACLQGENTTVIEYELVGGPSPVILELHPFCSCRDFHGLSRANDAIYKGYLFDRGIFRTKNYTDSPELFISVPGSDFHPTAYWFHNFEYTIEQERGLEFKEDLFNHGKFVVTLRKRQKLGVIISTDDPSGRDAVALMQTEAARRKTLAEPFADQPVLQRLALSADQFIVRRQQDLRSIIAGYHWFSDWGRDTMIALPGLCLVTKRFDDAKKILRAFAGHVSEGMLPNRFPDHGEKPEYNTIDATLWFFQACYRYVKASGDEGFVKEFSPLLHDIVQWHDRGTRYQIHVESDDLLYGGEPGVQLTWMDAKVGDWVVTPRRGKAVEINALWHNALCVLSEFATLNGDDKIAAEFSRRSQQVRRSFEQVFWDEELGYLRDYVDGDVQNSDLRPNQLYALGLSFPIITGARAKSILKHIEEKLVTPRGLRSLDPSHADYKPTYLGNVWQRDGAYHQGTSWSFLIGPYIDALINVKGSAGVKQAKTYLRHFVEHLDEAGLGSVSEIFDAEEPHAPRGCIAQAWGVAELLRQLHNTA